MSSQSKTFSIILAVFLSCFCGHALSQTGAPLTSSQAGVFYEDRLKGLGELTSLGNDLFWGPHQPLHRGNAVHPGGRRSAREQCASCSVLPHTEDGRPKGHLQVHERLGLGHSLHLRHVWSKRLGVHGARRAAAAMLDSADRATAGKRAL